MAYAAAGCTGSSKAPTLKNGGLNEDRFQISSIRIGSDPSALYVGVFDGHGGPGASSYLVEHYLSTLESGLEVAFNSSTSEGKTSLEAVLLDSFLRSDRLLYEDVSSIGRQFSQYREERCKCSFYRESPCRCMRAPRSAHEGSTATVLLLTGDRIYCANVGDSEAMLVTRSGFIKSTSDSGSREYDVVGAPSALNMLDPKTPPAPPLEDEEAEEEDEEEEEENEDDKRAGGQGEGAQVVEALEEQLEDETSADASHSGEKTQKEQETEEMEVVEGLNSSIAIAPAGGHAAEGKVESTASMDEEDEGTTDKATAASLSHAAAASLGVEAPEPPRSCSSSVSSPSSVGQMGGVTLMDTQGSEASFSKGRESTNMEMTNVGDGPTSVKGDLLEGKIHFMFRKVEPGTVEGCTDLRAETMTIADTPIPDLSNEDYIRVKHIAQTRTRRKPSKARSSRNDGIRRGPSHRFNYVALEGAHSLNMTRAFGNYGHKVFSPNDSSIIEVQSPIIVRPHVNIFEPAYENDFLFVVVASDGLWDNLGKDEVTNIVADYCRRRVDASADKESLLAKLAEGCSEELLSRAISRNRKLDDITVVVVLFRNIFEAIRQGDI